MPKVKTHKGAAKRLRKTSTGKLLKRTAGQSHFNSRESGKVTRNKRRDGQVSTHFDHIARRVPYL